jgi:hypothetical protein
MKRSLLAAAALILMTATPTLAEPTLAQHAYGLQLAFVYHMGCQKLPPDLIGAFAVEVQKLPESALKEAEATVHAQLVRYGPTEFCARAKELIADMMGTALRESLKND